MEHSGPGASRFQERSSSKWNNENKLKNIYYSHDSRNNQELLRASREKDHTIKHADLNWEPEPSVDYDFDADTKAFSDSLGGSNFCNSKTDILNEHSVGHPQYAMDMQLVERGSIFLTGSTETSLANQLQMKNRKSKMKSISGYDYYRHHVSNRNQANNSEDLRSLRSLKSEDLKETRQFLTSVRIHSKSRKCEDFSKKFKTMPQRKNVADDVSSNGDEEYGLPSMRQKIKSLTERLHLTRLQQSTAEVARQYRKAVWSIPNGRLHFYTTSIIKAYRSVSDTISDVWYRLNFWSQQFKEIEGHFGIATTTYFRFTRWLVKINFMVFFLFLCFIYIPQLTHSSIFDDIPVTNTNGSGEYFEKMFRCSNSYHEHIKNVSRHKKGWQTFLEVAQGTGFLENTMLFYGFYTNLTFWIPSESGTLGTKYNMGLAYLLTVGISFVAVFVMIVKNSSRTVEETVMDFDNKVFPVYTNAVFSGWDYCINSEKMAFFKQKIIYNEFKAKLEEVESKRQRENRTAKERAQLYLKRFVINLVVLALLGGAFYAIYLATEYLLEKQTENLSGILLLLINYLPSIVISVLNLVVPEIFLALSNLEEYTHSFATHITIVRAVFLRLASVWMLIGSLYYRLLDEEHKKPFACAEEEKFNATNLHCCGNTLWDSDREPIKCWESYVGKQFYKLGILDFISVTSVVFLVKIPRRIIYQHLRHRFWIIARIGRSKFDLPLQVLDIVYSQTVCWMGMFFTPLLPAITFVKVFFFFFLKKFELLNVTESPRNAYRASRSYSFFQTVLLVSFIVISSLLSYMIGNLQPSMSCGPFRLYSNDDFVMFDVISNEVNSWSEEPKKIVKYFGTVAFFIPAFLILLLAMYYYWAIAVGYKKMEELLMQQLKSEAHDKQYLLARVDEIIKKGQLNPDVYNIPLD